MVFVIMQIIGVIAWLLLLASYYMKDTNKIISVQLISTICYCINYLFLGAFGGLIINTFEGIRDYLYYKTDKDHLIFMLTIPLYIIIGYFTANNLIGLLPIIASLLEAFSLTKRRKTVIGIAVINNFLWMIYDVSVAAYTVSITDGLLMLSNMSILLFGYSRLIKTERLLVVNRHTINNDTLNTIQRLDQKYYDDKLLWNLEYQRNILEKNKDSITLIKDGQNTIGYISYLVLNEEEYQNIINNNVVTNTYNIKNIKSYRKSVPNYIVIDSIVIQTSYQNYKTVKLFTNTIKSFLRNKFNKGYKILGIVSIATTSFESDVLSECGFELIRKIDTDYALYVLSNESLTYFLKENKKKVDNNKNLVLIKGKDLEDDIIKEINDLNRQYLDHEYIWNDNYYQEIFNNNKDSLLIIKDKKKLVGYINYLVIDKDLYLEIKDSLKLKKEFRLIDVLDFKKNKNYLILNKIVIDKSYRDTKVIRLLSNGLRKELRRKNKSGFLISGLVSYGITHDGKKFLENYGFKKYRKMEDGNTLYLMEYNSLKKYLANIKQD